MGMTIDESMKVIEPTINNGASKIDCALEIAIDTMHKYQKIQEIVRWNNAPSPYYKPDGQLFREICEVLEDGNDMEKTNA